MATDKELLIDFVSTATESYDNIMYQHHDILTMMIKARQDEKEKICKILENVLDRLIKAKFSVAFALKDTDRYRQGRIDTLNYSIKLIKKEMIE